MVRFRLAVCFLYIGLATLCYTAANPVTKHCIFSVIVLLYHCSDSKMQPDLLAQLSEKSILSQQQVFISTGLNLSPENTHIHKTTKHFFIEIKWLSCSRAAHSETPLNRPWTVYLFSLGCLVDNQLICNDDMPKRPKWGHSLRLCW